MDATTKEPVRTTGTSISALETAHSTDTAQSREAIRPSARDGKPEAQKGPVRGRKSVSEVSKAALTGSSKRARLFQALLIAGALGGAWLGYHWLTIGRYMVETDDAYVQADVATLGVKVSGYIAEVPVKNGDAVHAGDVVVRLDDIDYRTALNAAKARRATQTATIDRIERQIEAQKAAVDSAHSGVVSAQAEVVRTLAAFDRAKELSDRNFGSKATLDQATADRDRAAAALTTAQAAVAAAEANFAVVTAQKAEAEQTAKEFDVAITKAANDLDATVIRAPTDGIVGNRAAQPGQYAAPGARLMALVPLKSIYVAANFKETQLATLKAGQPVEVYVDSLDGEVFKGVVGKTSPASGAVFSLLPPENATGNFTKVIQRVPVRVEVPADEALTGKLLPGMSVVVKVDTRGTKK